MQQEPYSHVRPDDYGLYSTPDEEAPECEVEELIAAFVCALKPLVVVETGTARGFTAQRIGRVLADNNQGKLYTFEVDSDKCIEAQTRTRGLPVWVQNYAARAVDPFTYGPVDLLYIDAVLEERDLEYRHWEPALSPGGIAILHDTMKFDPPMTAVSKLEGEKIWVPTPRGLTLIQKTKPPSVPTA